MFEEMVVHVDLANLYDDVQVVVVYARHIEAGFYVACDLGILREVEGEVLWQCVRSILQEGGHQISYNELIFTYRQFRQTVSLVCSLCGLLWLLLSKCTCLSIKVV